jgi:hypothetical protein
MKNRQGHKSYSRIPLLDTTLLLVWLTSGTLGKKNQKYHNPIPIALGIRIILMFLYDIDNNIFCYWYSHICCAKYASKSKNKNYSPSKMEKEKYCQWHLAMFVTRVNSKSCLFHIRRTNNDNKAKAGK